MANKKHDWLGLCLDMMSEYFPSEIHFASDSKKYWDISEHFQCLMERMLLDSPNNTILNRHEYFLKDLIKKLHC